MSNSTSEPVGSKFWGVVIALGMALLALFPQIQLWHDRGRDWQGAHAFFYTDEPAYAAYVNALIDGRPRRCDPYTGLDDSVTTRVPESLFSIQFIPAYMLAVPARMLRLSTATVFIIAAPLVAFLSSLALFWFLTSSTGDRRLAAALVPLVLCFGILLSGNGLIRRFLNLEGGYVYLPFLRRYTPAVPFVFFVLFFPLTWKSVTVENRRRRLLSVFTASICFVICLYGYFYLWTALAAWLVLMMLLWSIAKPAGWRRGLSSLGLIGCCAIVATIPYAILLSQRAATMDVVQALVKSHRPDVWRSIEICALLVIVLLVLGLKRGRLEWRDQRVLMTCAFALLPFIVFNQQVITGRSLQPMHYEQFVVPYTTLIAAALTTSLLWQSKRTDKRLPLLAIIMLGSFSYSWGAGETLVATRRFAAANVARDQARGIGLRLRQLAFDGPMNQAGTAAYDVVFATDYARADYLPMTGPQAVLWAPHMFVFSGVTLAEHKRRFFQYLYYSGVSADDFVNNYQRRGFVHYAIFGWERANPKLTLNYKPISEEELRMEAKNYADYVDRFDLAQARQPTLSYVLWVPASEINFDNLDRWYSRDGGEQIGGYILYRVKPRP